MIYARIQNGVVAELFETTQAIATLFHPSLVWVACDATTLVGDMASQSGGAWSFAKPSPPVLTFDAYTKATADGVSAWLSAYVKDSYGYDDIISAASYAGDKNPKFNAEGTAAKEWRSDCFAALYQAMPTYQAMPPEQWPTLDYVMANLPQPSAYQWTP